MNCANISFKNRIRVSFLFLALTLSGSLLDLSRPWVARAEVPVVSLGTTPSAPLATNFIPAKIAEIDAAILDAIAKTNTPGGVVWLEHQGAVYTRAYGLRAVVPASEPATLDTIYDSASLTKVLATAPSVLLLYERGKLQLDAPVQQYLPEFKGEGKDSITLRHLLTHVSGLPGSLTVRPRGYQASIAQACREKLDSTPGTVFRYSDVNFILLGEIVRRVSGETLADFAAKELYQPLKMKDTSYLPPAEKRGRIAPTEEGPDGMLRGVVHDGKAQQMAGVAGHAGVFTTAEDVARFARMMLNGGTLDGTRLFKEETIRLMTSVQSPPGIKAKRALGWDIDSPYAGPRGKAFPVGSYGHTGWTGPSLWIDPSSKTFIIFLCNRNHPDGKGNVVPLRGILGTLAAEAVGMTRRPEPEVKPAAQ